MSLANQYQMSDRSKYELIRKIMDVLEDAMEDDKRLDDDQLKQEAPQAMYKLRGFSFDYHIKLSWGYLQFIMNQFGEPLLSNFFIGQEQVKDYKK